MSNLFKKSLKEHTDLINSIHSLENKIMMASKKIFNLKKIIKNYLYAEMEVQQLIHNTFLPSL